MAINRSSRGKWLVQVRDRNGAWYPQKSFETKREAEDYELELKTMKRQGVKVKSRDLREYTLSQYWLRWSAECRSEVSLGWQKSQDQMWRDHIEPVLGLVNLVDFARSDVALFLSKMKAKGLGGQMRLHLYNLLHTMIASAVEIYEVRDSNPVVKALKPEVHTKKQNFYKPAVAKRFLENVKDHRLGVAFWIMIHCGFRTGEIQALRRSNIDFDDCSITVHEQWVRKEQRFGPLKNREPLIVPMPLELARYLKSRLKPGMRPDEFVVSSRSGGMIHHGTLFKALKSACEESGLTGLSPHQLRHTCSELWVEQGATQQDLRRLFNHSSEKSTERYIHKTDERLRMISQKGNTSQIRRVK